MGLIFTTPWWGIPLPGSAADRYLDHRTDLLGADPYLGAGDDS
jgi:hypothetical protein